MRAVEMIEETTITTPDFEELFAGREKKTVIVDLVEDGVNGIVIKPLPTLSAANGFCEFTFQLGSVPTGFTASFDDPAFRFSEKVPAFTMARMADGTVKLLWGNLDPSLRTLTFDYTVRVRVRAAATGVTRVVTHDPTVQNDPPTPPPTFP